MFSFVFLLYSLLILIHFVDSKYLYQQQFKPGNENLQMPPVLLFSVYMGQFHYGHIPLLLESMRYNPQVTFQLLHISEKDEHHSELNKLLHLAQKMNVPNFKVKSVLTSELRQRVKDKLGIDVPFDNSYFYKLCDYKPTLAHLFPELVSNQTYKYWGYGDMDLVWGNFSRFAHWFQGDTKFIISGWFGTTGAFAMYINEDWTTKLFYDSPLYVPLLKNLSYHNLDEGGVQTQPELVVEGGKHSISELQKKYYGEPHGMKVTRAEFEYGRNGVGHWKDHAFIDEGDSRDWAGPAIWHRGSLKIVQGSEQFPPGRELLFFHRPALKERLDLPNDLRHDIFQDMMTYGYLLPSFVPIFTRHICPQTGMESKTIEAMHSYRPYNPTCFASNKHGYVDSDVSPTN